MKIVDIFIKDNGHRVTVYNYLDCKIYLERKNTGYNRGLKVWTDFTKNLNHLPIYPNVKSALSFAKEEIIKCTMI